MNRVLCQGKRFGIEERQVESPDGRTIAIEVVTGPSVVRVYPISDRGIWLIHEFRPEVGRVVLRVVSGRVKPDESPLDAAARELREEIGGVARDLILERSTRPILKVDLLTHHIRCALSSFVERRADDVTSGITAEWIPLKRLPGMVYAGEIIEDTVALQLLLLSRDPAACHGV